MGRKPAGARLASALPNTQGSPGRLTQAGLLGWANTFAVGLCLSLPLQGCQSKPAETPRGTVDAYADALKDGRLDDAYALLSQETQNQLALADFKKLVKTNPAAITALVDALSSPGNAAHVRATITGGDGSELQLVYEDGKWRIEPSGVDLFPNDTPLQVIQSFVKAYDAKRWDILVSFAPKADQSELSPAVLSAAWEGEQKEEMRVVVEAIRTALQAPKLEILGERATMSYGDLGVVELVLEDGAWKIEDFR